MFVEDPKLNPVAEELTPPTTRTLPRLSRRAGVATVKGSVVLSLLALLYLIVEQLSKSSKIAN